MSFLLLRNSFAIKNSLESTFRKRRGISFRKALGVYNYKIKPKQYYKNPHGMNLQHKEVLKQQGDRGMRKIRAIEDFSIKPFGRFNRQNRFIIEKQRIPLYDIKEYEADFPVIITIM